MLCSEWSPPTAATRKLLHLCVSTSMAVFKNYPYLFISSDKFLCYSPVVVRLYSSPPHHFYLTLTTGRHYLLFCWALLLLYFPKPWMTCLSPAWTESCRALQFHAPTTDMIHVCPCMIHMHIVLLYLMRSCIISKLTCSSLVQDFLFYIFGPAKTELKEMKDFWIYQITSLNY